MATFKNMIIELKIMHRDRRYKKLVCFISRGKEKVAHMQQK